MTTDAFLSVASIFHRDPERIGAFLDTYDEQAGMYLADLARAIETEDAELARDVIHRWKSSSAMVGAPEVSAATMSLRESCVGGDYVEAAKRFESLRALHQASVARLRARIPEVCR